LSALTQSAVIRLATVAVMTASLQQAKGHACTSMPGTPVGILHSECYMLLYVLQLKTRTATTTAILTLTATPKAITSATKAATTSATKAATTTTSSKKNYLLEIFLRDRSHRKCRGSQAKPKLV